MQVTRRPPKQVQSPGHGKASTHAVHRPMQGQDVPQARLAGAFTPIGAPVLTEDT